MGFCCSRTFSLISLPTNSLWRSTSTRKEFSCGTSYFLTSLSDTGKLELQDPSWCTCFITDTPFYILRNTLISWQTKQFALQGFSFWNLCYSSVKLKSCHFSCNLGVDGAENLAAIFREMSTTDLGLNKTGRWPARTSIYAPLCPLSC